MHAFVDILRACTDPAASRELHILLIVYHFRLFRGIEFLIVFVKILGVF